MKFRDQLWKAELNEIISSFSNLHDPIVIQGLLEKGFAESRLMKNALTGFRVVHEQSGVLISDSDVEQQKNEFVRDYTRSLSGALDVYKRQILVLFTTHLEVITEEFVQCLFCCNPQLMHDYTENDRGLISLKDALKFKTRNAMINSLAARSCTKFMDAKWPTIFSRIEKAVKTSIPEKEQLLKLTQTRNRIVHENKKPAISVTGLYKTCSSLEQYIEFCVTTLNVKCATPTP